MKTILSRLIPQNLSVVLTCQCRVSGVFLCALLSACTTYEYHVTKNIPLQNISTEQEQGISEAQLLDVGVVLFDDGVDVLDDESAAYSSVRQSEAVWFSSQLKNTLEQSNAWGLVRTLPTNNGIVDLKITGKLLESNGEVVSVWVSAVDASGKVWFTKEYLQRASAYAYHPEIQLEQDPFQAMFNEIANDLFNHQAGLTPEQRINIRSIAKVKFARDFVPQAFDDYLIETESGEIALQRIPASNDPMMERVERIQARNDLYLDVVQDYYRAFNRNMSLPYQEWRKISYKEVVYERQLKEQARKEKIASIATIAAGVVVAAEGNSGRTRAAGYLATIGGAQLFRRAYAKADEARLHSETLREMGASLEAELEPSIVDLQDRSITLSGTVEDQYQEWRRILSRMFELEEGNEVELPVETTQLQTSERSVQGAIDNE